jgi:hypothetical protein
MVTAMSRHSRHVTTMSKQAQRHSRYVVTAVSKKTHRQNRYVVTAMKKQTQQPCGNNNE